MFVMIMMIEVKGKVGKHKGTSPLKSLHKGTGCRDLSHKQFSRRVRRNKSQGLVPKILSGLN